MKQLFSKNIVDNDSLLILLIVITCFSIYLMARLSASISRHDVLCGKPDRL